VDRRLPPRPDFEVAICDFKKCDLIAQWIGCRRLSIESRWAGVTVATGELSTHLDALDAYFISWDAQHKE